MTEEAVQSLQIKKKKHTENKSQSLDLWNLFFTGIHEAYGTELLHILGFLAGEEFFVSGACFCGLLYSVLHRSLGQGQSISQNGSVSFLRLLAVLLGLHHLFLFHDQHILQQR